jgi:hypothetical protein
LVRTVEIIAPGWKLSLARATDRALGVLPGRPHVSRWPGELAH